MTLFLLCVLLWIFYFILLYFILFLARIFCALSVVLGRALLCAFVFICVHNINLVFLCETKSRDKRQGHRDRGQGTGGTGHGTQDENNDNWRDQLVCAGKSVKDLAHRLGRTWNNTHTLTRTHNNIYTNIFTVPVSTRHFFVVLVLTLEWIFVLFLYESWALIWLPGGTRCESGGTKDDFAFIMRATNRNQRSNLIKI